MLLKAIKTHSDLNFVDSPVSTYENLPRKMRFSGSYLELSIPEPNFNPGIRD